MSEDQGFWVSGPAERATRSLSAGIVLHGPTLAENGRQVFSIDSDARRASQAAACVGTSVRPDMGDGVTRPSVVVGVDLEAAVRSRSARVLTDREFAARAGKERSRMFGEPTFAVSKVGHEPETTRGGRKPAAAF